MYECEVFVRVFVCVLQKEDSSSSCAAPIIKKHILQVSTHQMAVLMHFNKRSLLTFQVRSTTNWSSIGFIFLWIISFLLWHLHYGRIGKILWFSGFIAYTHERIGIYLFVPSPSPFLLLLLFFLFVWCLICLHLCVCVHMYVGFITGDPDRPEGACASSAVPGNG